MAGYESEVEIISAASLGAGHHLNAECRMQNAELFFILNSEF
jgi:hypothetical protein